jgi:hypothetical protein
VCGTYFNSSTNAQTFGNGSLDLGAFGHDFQVGDAILFNMHVSIVALPFTADRDSGNNKPLYQSEQNTDHGRRWNEPQHESLAEYHLDRLLVCLPQQTHQNLSSLVYMILFFSPLFPSVSCPRSTTSFKALLYLALSSAALAIASLAKLHLFCSARARSLSLCPVHKPPQNAPEPTPNQVRVNHNSFGNSIAFTGEFSPNFDLKISFRVRVIFIFWRNFSFHGKKNGPNLPDFEENKLKIPDHQIIMINFNR